LTYRHTASAAGQDGFGFSWEAGVIFESTGTLVAGNAPADGSRLTASSRGGHREVSAHSHSRVCGLAGGVHGIARIGSDYDTFGRRIACNGACDGDADA